MSNSELEKLQWGIKSARMLAIGWIGFGLVPLGGAIGSELVAYCGLGITAASFVFSVYYAHKGGATEWWKNKLG